MLLDTLFWVPGTQYSVRRVQTSHRVNAAVNPGVHAGLTGRWSIASAVVLVVALGVAVTLVIDLDRPRDGFLQVSQQPLLDLLRTMGPPPP